MLTKTNSGACPLSSCIQLHSWYVVDFESLECGRFLSWFFNLTLLRNLNILSNCNLRPRCLVVSAVEVVKSPKPKTDNVEKGKGKIGNGSSSFVSNGKSHAAESESWPHKHRPQSITEIIGNQSIVTPLKPCLSVFQ